MACSNVQHMRLLGACVLLPHGSVERSAQSAGLCMTGKIRPRFEWKHNTQYVHTHVCNVERLGLHAWRVRGLDEPLKNITQCRVPQAKVPGPVHVPPAGSGAPVGLLSPLMQTMHICNLCYASATCWERSSVSAIADVMTDPEDKETSQN